MLNKKLLCEECGSSNVYTTLTEQICRKCGHRAKRSKK